MRSFQPLPLLLLLCLLFFTLHCTADDSLAHSCNNNTSLAPEAVFNLDMLLTVFKQVKNYYFFFADFGDGADAVTAMFQCRRDVSSTDCSSCIEAAATQIRQACPKQSDAKIWFDFCFLRHSQTNFIGSLDTSGSSYAEGESVSFSDELKQELRGLFDQINKEAVQPSSGGIGKAHKVLGDITLYALVQCTQDVKAEYCSQCLADGIQNFQGVCEDKTGCRVLYGSCYLRYEFYPFFFSTDTVKLREYPSIKGYVN